MKLGKTLVAFCLAASLLVGCGGKPSDLSEDTYELGLKALEVTEDYLAADLEIGVAYEKIKSIEKRMSVNEEYSGDELIYLTVGLIETQMQSANRDSSTEKKMIPEIKEEQKDLKKQLGK